MRLRHLALVVLPVALALGACASPEPPGPVGTVEHVAHDCEAAWNGTAPGPHSLELLYDELGRLGVDENGQARPAGWAKNLATRSAYNALRLAAYELAMALPPEDEGNAPLPVEPPAAMPLPTGALRAGVPWIGSAISGGTAEDLARTVCEALHRDRALAAHDQAFPRNWLANGTPAAKVWVRDKLLPRLRQALDI